MLVGIDPDVDKNGVASKHNQEVLLQNLTFFELFDFLNKHKDEIAIVVIEGGWLNKGNWHTDKNGSAAKNAAIGNNTGRNHETGRKIVEMVEYIGLKYFVTRPRNAKMSDKLFKLITKIKRRTNQEQRDAYMLIHKLNIKP